MKVPSGAPRNRLKSILEDLISPGVCFLVVAFFTGIFFTTRNGDSNDANNGFSCSDNNPTFPWEDDWNRIWDSRMFLSVNLAQGRFTYSQAKAIDICWDLVLGRGGQMYAAFVAYRIMRRSLIRSMESKPMHIPVTASLIFEGLSIWALGRIYNDLVATLRKRGTCNWRLVAFLWMILYLMSFGTIVSAMTGYQAQMTPFYIERSNASSLTASSMITQADIHAGAVIQNGSSIGLEPFATLSNSTHPAQYAILEYYQDLLDTMSKSNNKTVCDRIARNGSTQAMVMSAWLDDECHHVNSSMIFQDRLYIFEPDALDIKLQNVYIVNGTLMNQTYLGESSVCQPGKTYRWGFSSQLLFMFCMMTIVYAGVVAALHWDVYEFGRADTLEHRPGLYRDILDMAEEIHDELDDGDTYLTADVLDKRITTRTGAIAVDTEGLPPSRRDDRLMEEHRRLRRYEALAEYASTNYETLLRTDAQYLLAVLTTDDLERRSTLPLRPGETEGLPLRLEEISWMRILALEEYARVNYKAILRTNAKSSEGLPLKPEEVWRMREVALKEYARVNHEALLFTSAKSTEGMPLKHEDILRLRKEALKAYACLNYEALFSTNAKSIRSSSGDLDNEDTNPLVAVETEGSSAVKLKRPPLDSRGMRQLKRWAIEEASLLDYEAFLRM